MSSVPRRGRKLPTRGASSAGVGFPDVRLLTLTPPGAPGTNRRFPRVPGRVAQWYEHHVDTVRVAGSIPAAPTTCNPRRVRDVTGVFVSVPVTVVHLPLARDSTVRQSWRRGVYTSSGRCRRGDEAHRPRFITSPSRRFRSRGLSCFSAPSRARLAVAGSMKSSSSSARSLPAAGPRDGAAARRVIVQRGARPSGASSRRVVSVPSRPVLSRCAPLRGRRACNLPDGEDRRVEHRLYGRGCDATCTSTARRLSAVAYPRAPRDPHGHHGARRRIGTGRSCPAAWSATRPPSSEHATVEGRRFSRPRWPAAGSACTRMRTRARTRSFSGGTVTTRRSRHAPHDPGSCSPGGAGPSLSSSDRRPR